ncbi:hypothetical protein J5581_05450 [Streptococcus suis]|uniref:hypothetical protein n=1 Tax=Streptococcus suis TaxID=1307 RepID=UPI00041593F9|nr:hypothetical protein [Streptococcus suis]MBM7203784.1 hypothetical protein [Streptococcus suis]MBM7282907.1 hypothetical protein [Streptococcus suis]MBO4135335.1 hypothetical protein [Streptococcus suis]
MEAELARLESVGMRLERSIDRALEMARDYPDYEWHAHSMMRQLNQVIDRKNKVRRQLQALYAFNERSSSFFSGIGDLETQLSQGIVQVGSDMSNFSGSFPSGLSPVWVSKVNQKWKRMRDTSSPADFRKLDQKSQEEYIKSVEVERAYQDLVKKVEKGEALTKEELLSVGKYAQEYPNVPLPKQLQKAYPLNEFIQNYGVPALAGLAVDEVTGRIYSKFLGETIEESFINIGVESALQNAQYIYSNRYAITNSAGDIIGKIPGATHEAIVRESAESVAKYSARAGIVNAVIGEAVSFGPGVLVGAGINMASGDTAEEAWGKEIVTGATTAVITPIATVGVTTVLTGIGVIATGASLPVAAVVGVGIAVGIGVNIANDWLREEFPEVKEFEDNVGEAVVDGWNNLCNTASDTFSFVNPFD